MKKLVIYLSIILITGTILVSCEDMFGDFLDKAPGADLPEEQVFKEWKKTEMFFYDIYNFLPTGLNYINSSWLDAATDLGITSYFWGGVRTSLNIGNYYNTGGAPEVVDKWYHYFRGIRKVNIFLAKVDSVPLGSDETPESRAEIAKRMKAEARFLRAYFYWELVLRYGPVPIILDRLNYDDENLNTYQRPETIKPCIDFILNELDEIYPDLMNDIDVARSTTLSGRITKGICKALKIRILLYMASPLYNTNNEIEKWQLAMQEAESFIYTLGHKGQKVYELMTDLTPINAYEKAINVPAFQNNKEIIFWRSNPKGDWWRSESPVSFGGYGGLCPSQNLVDMYDMADGKSPFTQYDETGAPVYDENGIPVAINPSSGYSDQNPYANRDPRFYKTVLYNGSIWWNETIDTYEGGKDKPLGNTDATPTSYYNRKYHNEAAHYLYGGTVYRNWIIIRYAEILLNYAEARNEFIGPDQEVYNTLQLLRSRAGISGNLLTDRPGMTKEEMRNFIRKERAVELCYEEHRWWDVRRWKVADKALSRPIYGMKIVKNGNNFTYSRIKVQDRPFEPKMYLYPIPEKEIWKTGMKNNPGW